MFPTDGAGGASPARRRGVIRDGARTLHPGYFALVMASGIVSIAMKNQPVYWISVPLLWITAATYAVLVVLSLWRLISFRAELVSDLTNPSRGFGFYTFIAATDVLGTRLAGDGHHTVATVLLVVGWLAWVLLGYLIPWTAVLGRAERPVVADANGTWFIWVVASQSVAVLSGTLQPSAGSGRDALALVAVFSWAVGVFLYAAAGIFVAARMMLYELGPKDLTQPYWVSMGATAITVVGAAKIVQMANAPMADATRGLIAGAAVVIWAFGTWLIPALVAAGWWRHVVHRIPVRYDPTWWSVVFPLGMYSVACHYLGQVDHLPFLEAVGADESWVALAAWLLTFVAMLVHLTGPLRSQRAGTAAGPAPPRARHGVPR